MPAGSELVRLSGAGSTGRRNTGVKSLCWGFKLQGLTWPFLSEHAPKKFDGETAGWRQAALVALTGEAEWLRI
jgi:hypothetical protein